MTTGNGRVPVDPKFLWTVGGSLVLMGIVWGTLKTEASNLAAQVTTHEVQVQALAQEQTDDDLVQQRVSDQVEGIKQQVLKVEAKQEQLSVQQQAMTQQLYEQGYTLKKILEEVKKP